MRILSKFVGVIAVALLAGCGGGGGGVVADMSSGAPAPSMPAPSMPDSSMPAPSMPDSSMPAPSMPDSSMPAPELSPAPIPAPPPEAESAFMEIGTYAAVENPTTGVHPYSYNDWGFWVTDDQGETLMKAVLNTPEGPSDTTSPSSVYDPNDVFDVYRDSVLSPTSGSGTWIGKVRAAGYTEGWVPVEGDAQFTVDFLSTIMPFRVHPVEASFTGLRGVDSQTTYDDIQWLGVLGPDHISMLTGGGELFGYFYGEDYVLGGAFHTSELAGHFAAERN